MLITFSKDSYNFKTFRMTIIDGSVTNIHWSWFPTKLRRDFQQGLSLINYLFQDSEFTIRFALSFWRLSLIN